MMTTKTNILPDVWGQGQLLAFSALDGQTNWNEAFVMHTGDQPGSLILKLPFEQKISFSNMPSLKFKMILGDVIEAVDSGNSASRYAAVFTDNHTLTGIVPNGVAMLAGEQIIEDTPSLLGEQDGLRVFAAIKQNRWAIILTSSGEELEIFERIENALRSDIDEAIKDRSEYVLSRDLPADLSDDQIKLFRKAVSVMKVNVESACEKITRRWTTPDRWPHKNMWLWDSGFHSIGWSCIDPEMAKDAILAMLEQTSENGMLSHMVTPKEKSNITQPPILAWATLKAFEKNHDESWLRNCLPYLMSYLEWIRQNRDQNDNGLPEWFIEGDSLCRSGESGADNSSRFDQAVLLDAPDFASFLANDYKCLAKLGDAIGETKIAELASEHANRIGNAVNELLWSKNDQFYMDRDFDGNFTKIKAISGFMPLFAGIADEEKANALLAHIENPSTFATPLPIPSVSIDSGTWCKDMWRGPSWINMNYLTILGLKTYGFTEQAEKLKSQTLSAIQKWYEIDGSIFEYYDAFNVTSPRDLDRKQRLSKGVGMEAISDYHWTAALTVAMLAE